MGSIAWKGDKWKTAVNRRRFVACFSSVGLGTSLMPGALAAVAEDADTVTVEMLEAAQRIAGMNFTRAELEEAAERLNGDRSPLARPIWETTPSPSRLQRSPTGEVRFRRDRAG